MYLEDLLGGLFEAEIEFEDEKGGDSPHEEEDVEYWSVVLLSAGGGGHVDDLAGYRTPDDRPESAEQFLEAIVTTHLLDGDYNSPLEHHDGGGSEDVYEAPEDRVVDEDLGPVLPDPVRGLRLTENLLAGERRGLVAELRIQHSYTTDHQSGLYRRWRN